MGNKIEIDEDQWNDLVETVKSLAEQISNLSPSRPGADFTVLNGGTSLRNTPYPVKSQVIPKRRKFPNTAYWNWAQEWYKAYAARFPNLMKKVSPAMVHTGVDTIDRLVRLDGHDFHKEIKPALDWSIEDGFWSQNVRSLATLRKKSPSNGQTKFANLLASYYRDNKPKSSELSPKEVMARKHISDLFMDLKGETADPFAINAEVKKLSLQTSSRRFSSVVNRVCKTIRRNRQTVQKLSVMENDKLLKEIIRRVRRLLK